MQTQLPPRPDVVVPKPKRAVWKIAASIVGGLIVLGAIGFLVDGTKTETTASPTESVMTREEAATAATPLANEVTSILETVAQGGMADSIANDPSKLNHVAELMDQIAAIWTGVDDEIAGYMSSGADHYRDAADAIASGDFLTATDEIDAATDDVDAATKEL